MSTTASTDVALMLLQLIALTIPPAVVLIEQLRRSENLEWQFRKLSFGLVVSSIGLLIAGAVAVLLYFVATVRLPVSIYAGLLLVILGLLPLGAFVAVLYREHRIEHGP
ncbi:hypothetical protein HTZ84_10300 [Haloterrigena sp. SYSU A558-1]|uniref:Uncharacterized protein n=1 Tax=Haloterrigena gelatinilytica TaxID=2741724 RepID=A0A8J8GNC2_9EURY|nr:hypothetical protein [Haloterrigena gelatinilytica]NUB91567.1 hypothetical protein [Haloterrigena gelatinilytica]NUC72696.1 hypothetical protein [Haloterrigena gelatinilytica]